MARRKDKPKLTPSPHSTVTPPLSRGQDLLRRVLLGLVTALIVARPLVPTEDPGLRSPLPDPSGMVLTWLWLVALLGWTGWRFWTRQDGVRFGLIDVALLAVVGLNLLSAATAARYRYPAWLMTWEWLTFFIAFYLVRRLAVWPGGADGLLAALLATAVMLSAYAAYQRVVEMPATAKQTRAQLAAEMAEQGQFFDLDDPALAQLEERARSPNVFATFAHPNSFAGFLGLLLPAALGWTVAGRRAHGWSRQAVLLACSTALILLALWWTHSRGAVVAVLLVAAIGAVWLARRLIALQHLRPLLGLAALSVAIALLGYFGLREKNVGKVAPQQSFALRLGYWNATWKMIREQGWLGVGPGNFGRHYTAYMTETDYEEVQAPHNFALELWATCGFFGMAALLVGLGVFVQRAFLLFSSVPVPVPDSGQFGHGHGHGHGHETPWEFYLGGMAGLILGFILTFSARDLIFPADAGALDRLLMFLIAYHAPLLRSLIWFPAFALFLSVRWNGPARMMALIAGVAVLMLNLCLSDGVSIPTVAIPLWVVIALVVVSWQPDAKRRQSPVGRSGQFEFLRRLLPIPACAGLVMVYWALVLQPTALGARLARHALRAGEDFVRAAHAPPGGQLIRESLILDIRRNPVGFLQRHILRPLQNASEANPEDVRYLRWLAYWTGELWRITRRDEDLDAALNYARKAQTEDPLYRENWLIEAHLEVTASQALQLQAWNPTLAVSTPWGPFFTLQLPIQPLGALVRRFNEPSRTAAAKSAHVASENAAKALGKAVSLDPTQTRLRFQLMTGLQVMGRLKEAEREARRTLELDRKATHRSRKLTPEHRGQIQRWLDSRPVN